MVCVIQLEWIFLQHVTWNTGDAFTGVDKMIWETFFASYFLQKDEDPLPCRRISEYDAIQESWTETPEPSDISSGKVLKLHAREHRTDTGRNGGGEFSNANHLRTLSEEPLDKKKYQDVAHKPRLKGLVRNIKVTDKRLILRAKITGAWMSVHGTTTG